MKKRMISILLSTAMVAGAVTANTAAVFAEGGTTIQSA